jgi:hypothetical protein
MVAGCARRRFSAMTQDSGGQKQVTLDAGQVARGLRHPSTLLLVAANSLPIFGVLYWGWDVFVLLMLYWLETAIIGGWTIARIAIAPPGSMGKIEINGRPTVAGSLFIAGFFVVHSGIFMLVHMIFLWTLFSGAWSKIIHGPIDFVGKLIIGTDMWIPLLVLFVVRGLAFLFHVLRPEVIQRFEQSLHLRNNAPPEAAPADELGSIIGAFYGRIIVMHMTIIFSAFAAVIFGSIAPLIIMVAVKTVADVALHLQSEFGIVKKTSQTLSAASSR